MEGRQPNRLLSCIGDRQPRSRQRRKIRKSADEDRFSNLPSNVIEAILVRLPIKDAVRTSLLSPAWRYDWTNISELVFVEDESPTVYVRGDCWDFTTIVEHVLFLHKGALEKFMLFMYTKKCSLIDRWLLFLSTISIRHIALIMRGPMYEVPACLFSSEGITYLELRKCSIFPPPSFNGFSNLRTLELWKVIISSTGLGKLITNSPLLENLELRQIDDCTPQFLSIPSLVNLTVVDGSLENHCFQNSINLRELHLASVSSSSNGLEKFIANCPLLQNLTLRDITGCMHLKIRAPSLVNLEVVRCFERIYFEDAPVLAYASIRLLGYKDHQSSLDADVCKLTELLSRLPAIDRLELHDESYRILSEGNVPVRLRTESPLTYLLAKIDFRDIQDMLIALCIFRSSPYLQEVKIESIWVEKSDGLSVEGIWEAQDDIDCSLNQLQKIHLTRYRGTNAELRFIEFVLANAPVLKMVDIDLEDTDNERNFKRDLVRLPTISSKVLFYVTSPQ